LLAGCASAPTITPPPPATLDASAPVLPTRTPEPTATRGPTITPLPPTPTAEATAEPAANY